MGQGTFFLTIPALIVSKDRNQGVKKKKKKTNKDSLIELDL